MPRLLILDRELFPGAQLALARISPFQILPLQILMDFLWALYEIFVRLGIQ